jgi:hypothetical protein
MITTLLFTLAGAIGPAPLAASPLAATPPAAALDTLRLEVGSSEVDGRVFPTHLARNRVYVEPGAGPVNTWTNELSVGDSAGGPVMRWITRGVRLGPEGAGSTWELHQTYDARTLAPLTYFRTGSDGSSMRLRIEGTRVRGERRAPGSEPTGIDWTIDRPAFFAGASDLIPMAVGLTAGAVMTAPVWSPGMERPELRVFEVLEEVSVRVEGRDVVAWKVEERLHATGLLLATWYLTDRSPYMVLGEVPLSDGSVQRITGVDLDGGR